MGECKALTTVMCQDSEPWRCCFLQMASVQYPQSLVRKPEHVTLSSFSDLPSGPFIPNALWLRLPRMNLTSWQWLILCDGLSKDQMDYFAAFSKRATQEGKQEIQLLSWAIHCLC